MLKVIVSMMVGYLLGSLSPAALLSVVKKKDLRENGTGNLGATNTMLVLGKKYGIMVMLFDIAKAFISVKLANYLLPNFMLAGVLAGCCAIFGHIFPFYMDFKGGKGVATLAGLLLAIDPISIPILLTIGAVLSFVVNYAVAAPISASLCAPFLVGIRTHSMGVFVFLMVAGVTITVKHLINLDRIKDGTEIKLSEFIEEQSQMDELE